MKNRTLEDFTNILSSSEPVPGGGGATALVGSLAASLAEMVTNLTMGKKKYAEYEEEIQELMIYAEKLRVELLGCIEKDAKGFEPLSKAYSMPKDTLGYAETMESCLKQAASTPFIILELVCEVIKIDERLADIGSKIAVSDAATSVMFAYGALYGCQVNILVNTRLMKDREYADALDRQTQLLIDRYAPVAKNTYERIIKRLTNG